jgi:putative ATP-dependent endonuclease of OLD family
MADRVNLFQRLLRAALRLRPTSSGSTSTENSQPDTVTALPVLLLVEGRNDAEFLRRASAILHVADESLPDLGTLERRGQVTFVPLGGGDLLDWSYRLAGMARPEFHLYDCEDSPTTELRYQVANIVNQRPSCRAYVTAKRSLENYLTAQAVFAACGLEVTFGDDDDVADLVAERQYLARHPQCLWAELPPRSRRRRRNRVKSWLNSSAVSLMSAEQFAERDPAGEIRQWLTAIAEMVASAS